MASERQSSIGLHTATQACCADCRRARLLRECFHRSVVYHPIWRDKRTDGVHVTDSAVEPGRFTEKILPKAAVVGHLGGVRSVREGKECPPPAIYRENEPFLQSRSVGISPQTA